MEQKKQKYPKNWTKEQKREWRMNKRNRESANIMRKIRTDTLDDANGYTRKDGIKVKERTTLNCINEVKRLRNKLSQVLNSYQFSQHVTFFLNRIMHEQDAWLDAVRCKTIKAVENIKDITGVKNPMDRS